MKQKQAVNKAKAWGVYDDAGELHVKPLNDHRKHESDKGCWCKPTPDEVCTNLFVHHSMDERESYEEGRSLQ